eukprot:2272683-Pyramimonas_sp.AAC.2
MYHIQALMPTVLLLPRSSRRTPASACPIPDSRGGGGNGGAGCGCGSGSGGGNVRGAAGRRHSHRRPTTDSRVIRAAAGERRACSETSKNHQTSGRSSGRVAPRCGVRCCSYHARTGGVSFPQMSDQMRGWLIAELRHPAYPPCLRAFLTSSCVFLTSFLTSSCVSALLTRIPNYVVLRIRITSSC